MNQAGTKPLASNNITAKKEREKERKLIYLNEENLPLKRVRINPAYNTFVRLVFFQLLL